jgi:hypothetical protein
MLDVSNKTGIRPICYNITFLLPRPIIWRRLPQNFGVIMLYWSAFQRILLAALLVSTLWGAAALVIQMPEPAPSNDHHEAHEPEDVHEDSQHKEHEHDHNH